MKKLLVALLILALLAGYYIFGTGYLKQRQEQAALASETEAARQALAQAPARPAYLDQRLQAALAGEKAAGESMPERLNTTQVLDAILRLAEDHGVKAVPLVTQPWTNEAVAGYEYAVFRLELTLTGEFEPVATFLAALETGVPGTLVIEYLRLARPDEAPPDVTTVEAAVSVVIYARPDRP
jgi:Tfp pilus assembly protein PilO